MYRITVLSSTPLSFNVVEKGQERLAVTSKKGEVLFSEVLTRKLECLEKIGKVKIAFQHNRKKVSAKVKKITRTGGFAFPKKKASAPLPVSEKKVFEEKTADTEDSDIKVSEMIIPEVSAPEENVSGIEDKSGEEETFLLQEINDSSASRKRGRRKHNS